MYLVIEEPHCPWCKSESVVEIDMKSSQRTTVDGHLRRWNAAPKLLRCQNCGLWIKHPRPTAAELQEYYSNVDFSKWENPGLYPNERKLLSILQKLPKDSEILDIGCSTGRLLSRLTNSFECFGVEPNALSATTASANGISIVSQEDLTAPEFHERFAAVLLIDVFEHLLDPRSVIESAISCLRQDGLLAICTGDTGTQKFRQEKARFWYVVNEEHVIFFNRQFANHIATEFPLTISEWSNISHYDSNSISRSLLMYKRWLYRTLQHKSTFLRLAASLFPGARKARRWAHCPPNNLSADHVISVFRKQAQSR
ncbi:class I SAM-dependent methyltransferase [Gimesia maris]|uniref:class I SAM-dependent methyltransferase n=1 Tax=Gimesia maris TaxID=122 RepID=UPI003A93BEEF